MRTILELILSLLVALLGMFGGLPTASDALGQPKVIELENGEFEYEYELPIDPPAEEQAGELPQPAFTVPGGSLDLPMDEF